MLVPRWRSRQRCVPHALVHAGSGKTHTMLGGEADERGLIPRSVEFAFAKLAELAAKGWSYSVSAEMLEIYNEVSG